MHLLEKVSWWSGCCYSFSQLCPSGNSLSNCPCVGKLKEICLGSLVQRFHCSHIWEARFRAFRSFLFPWHIGYRCCFLLRGTLKTLSPSFWSPFLEFQLTEDLTFSWENQGALQSLSQEYHRTQLIYHAFSWHCSSILWEKDPWSSASIGALFPHSSLFLNVQTACTWSSLGLPKWVPSLSLPFSYKLFLPFRQVISCRI